MGPIQPQGPMWQLKQRRPARFAAGVTWKSFTSGGGPPVSGVVPQLYYGLLIGPKRVEASSALADTNNSKWVIRSRNLEPLDIIRHLSFNKLLQYDCNGSTENSCFFFLFESWLQLKYD